MLSSLLQLLKKALRRVTLAERARPTEALRTEPALAPSADPLPLFQGFEMDYWRDTSQGLQSQRLYVRVDTRELMRRLSANPDINLDVLADCGPPTEPAFEVSDWHRKVRRVTHKAAPTRH
jgi:hypothetical protein